MSLRRVQGEFFDCTIQGYNDNGHGRHKIEYGLQHGISIPIQKYIEELQMIDENTHDDKSEKRAERLDFLLSISQNPLLVSYFEKMTCYLNGGANFPDCALHGTNFEFNKIIFILAGGNIITILAKLLLDLLENGGRSDIEFNRLMINLWKFNEELSRWIMTCPKELKDKIFRLASYNYSDFDYNIIPNKCINHFRGHGLVVPKAVRGNAGFYLFRVKTAFQIEAPEELQDLNMKDAREHCIRAGIDDEKIKLFYPQGVQEDWLEDDAIVHNLNYYIEDDHEDIELCRDAIRKMLYIKGLIKNETMVNVSKIINLKSTQMGLRNELAGAIEYIRGITNYMNRLLLSLPSDITGCQTYQDRFSDWSTVVNAFSSLDTILASNLPYVSQEIIYHLINSDELGNFTDNFMDYRMTTERLTDPGKCRYTIVPSGLFRELYKLKPIMNKFMKNQEKPPVDGLRITFNNIIIEPRRELAIGTVPKVFAEEADLDDLADAFELLTMDDDRGLRINPELIEVVELARQQLMEDSGVGRKTKRKKKKKGRKQGKIGRKQGKSGRNPPKIKSKKKKGKK